MSDSPDVRDLLGRMMNDHRKLVNETSNEQLADLFKIIVLPLVEGSTINGHIIVSMCRRFDGLAALGEPPSRTGGHWMRTFTGLRMFPLNPKPEDICIEDIAHHLAIENRYVGATAWPYSVAQHSVLVSQMVPPELALQGLMHDATEAYLKDIPRPLKISPAFAGYKRIEARMHAVICERLGVSPELPPAIKAAERAVLAAERPALQRFVAEDAQPEEVVTPADVRIEEWSWSHAKRMFLARWAELKFGATLEPSSRKKG